MPSVDQFNVDHLAYGLAGGVAALAIATRPAARRIYPLLATLAIAALVPPLEMTRTIAVAAVVVAVATGWGAQRLARRSPATALAALGVIVLAGLWLAVPDTEPTIIALGVVVPGAVVSFVRRPTVADLVGWWLLAVTVVVIAAASSAEDLTVAVGALGCMGLVAMAPLVSLLDRRALTVLDLNNSVVRAVAAALVQVVIVLVCARVATAADDAPDAVAVVATCWVAGGALVLLGARTVRSAPDRV